MFEEASTGASGAVGRQVQLNQATTTGRALADTLALLDALELADDEGRINLQLRGFQNGAPILRSYRDGAYFSGDSSITRATLLAEAQAGTTDVVLTGWLRQNWAGGTQPLISLVGTGSGSTGDPALPHLTNGSPANPAPITLTQVDVNIDGQIFLDGAPVSGTITCSGSVTNSFCLGATVDVDLDAKPSNGLHLLQVQNPRGPMSNELPICVGSANGCD